MEVPEVEEPEVEELRVEMPRAEMPQVGALAAEEAATGVLRLLLGLAGGNYAWKRVWSKKRGKRN
jgi:hypothetical protein